MALIKSTDEILKKLDIAKSFNFAKVEPYIAQAEEDFLIPILSQDQYDDLQTKYDAAAGTPLAAPFIKLLELSQTCIAFRAFLLYAPNSRVSLTNAGVMSNRPQNAAPSAQWEHKDFLKSLRATSDKWIEKLLKHLEENKATFTLWANSDSFTQSKDTFINTADEFNKYMSIGSRYTFQKIIPFMKSIEDLHIKRLICKDQYDVLKTEHFSDSLSLANASLLDKLKYIIANQTVSRAVDLLNAEITDQGIRLRNTTDTFDRTSSPTIGQLRDFRATMKAEYKMREEDLKLFLEENIADYPLYEGSTCYASKAVPGPSHQVANASTDKGFIL